MVSRPRIAPGEGGRCEARTRRPRRASVLAGRCNTYFCQPSMGGGCRIRTYGPRRGLAVFKTAAIAALPSLHTAEGKGLEPPDAHRASRFRGGCNRRSAIPPTMPAAAGGGESRIRTYEGREAPSRLQRVVIAAL